MASDGAARTIEIPGGLPYDPFRTSLYTCEELMSGWQPGVAPSADTQIEQHVLAHGFRAPPAAEALAQRLHDHAVDQALAAYLGQAGRARRVVGIMGSAATARDDRWYRAAAELGLLLARAGFLVASGGGPGIMEAANLGAFLAPVTGSEVLFHALDELARAPTYEHDPDGYVAAADAIRRRYAGEGGESIAIPTWFYPGEPVGQFASHIAKYFANSIREEGLLGIAVAGIVFAPGRAGTTQELFQDAAQNAYSVRGQSPMVLLGEDFWDGEPSVHAVLRDQARRFGGYERLVGLCDTPGEAVAFIGQNQPLEVTTAGARAVLDLVRNERLNAR